MPYVRVSLDGREYTVELDSDGRIEGVGDSPVAPSFTVASELPISLRQALGAKIRIVRERCILDGGRIHTYLRACIDGHDCNGRTIVEVCATFAARCESVDYVDDPVDAARRACIILSGDKGIPCRIESNNGRDYDVVTDNGKRFRFCRK